MLLITIGQSWPCRMLAQFYFYIIRVVFSFWYSFIDKGCLRPITEDILLQSACEIARRIRAREVTSEAVVQAFIDRINEVDPVLNCVVRTDFVQAIATARQIDESLNDRSAPNVNDAPFLGVPFTTKDSITVAGFPCTVGIVRRKNLIMSADAVVIASMRKAGAVFLGMTNVSEVAMWWESSNKLFGRSKNPYDHRRIVGGSSGGEGCLISAAGSAIGVGSDIGGSIRLPAFFNGVFGHKATSGIISTKGLLPGVSGYRELMVTAGPICRYAEDLLPLVRVLAGENVGKLKLNEQVDVNSLKVFYMEGLDSVLVSPMSEAVRNDLYRAVDYFEQRSGIPPTKIDLPLVHWALSMWAIDMGGYKGEHAKFTAEMANREGHINVAYEWFRWLFAPASSPHTLPALCLTLVEKIADSAGSDKERKAVIGFRKRLQAQLQELLGSNGILLFPSHPTHAPFHNQPLFMPMNFIYTALFNSLGFPVSQCPLGLNQNGVPTGIQVIAAPLNDHLTLAVAKELEAGFGGWVNFPE